MSASELSKKLILLPIPQRWWRVQACCANSGDGLQEGLDWICAKLHAAPDLRPGPEHAQEICKSHFGSRI
jgi:hypothetical protein